MPVALQGSVNLASLYVPDVYVNVIPPQVAQLNGVPTNILGIVGVASWGPKNAPQVIGGNTDGQALFGGIGARAYDLMTAVDIAVQQGANNFRLVRVTDSTDVAASYALTGTPGNCITFTSLWTGSAANGDKVYLANGSKANTWKVTVVRAGLQPEVFDNLGSGLTGSALWAAIAAAINTGIANVRGPSKLITAAVPGSSPGTDAPTVTSYTLAGGLDGATGVTKTQLLGVDTLPRTGMYALRGTGASLLALPELSDSTAWATVLSFVESEGMYAIVSGPSSDSIATAVSTKASAGIDAPSMKIMFGDWCYYNDTTNGVDRLVSPVAYVAGLLSNLSPEQSSLNKPLNGIVATQNSTSGIPYAAADVQTLAQAGIDVITNPIPYGNAFGCRLGLNSSSNNAENQDNYPRMTNFLAFTMAGGMGKFIGKPQTPQVRHDAKSTQDDFLNLLLTEGMIDSFGVILDDSNNPPSQVSAGYMQANVQVRYLSIIRDFIVNLQAGQTVTVSTPINP